MRLRSCHFGLSLRQETATEKWKKCVRWYPFMFACMWQLCDQHGTKIMQRYIKFRRLEQLMGEIGTLSVAKRTSAPAQASLAVDPRQVSRSPTHLIAAWVCGVA